VPSVSFSSLNGGKVLKCYLFHFIGGTVLVPPLLMVQTYAPNKKKCKFYDCSFATMLAVPLLGS
jgi:hypothetical protein